MRFSDIVNRTVRFGAVICPAVRFGAVFKNRKCYGAVRFFMYPTVRFGEVNRSEPHRTDRKNRTVKNPGIYGLPRMEKSLVDSVYPLQKSTRYLLLHPIIKYKTHVVAENYSVCTWYFFPCSIIPTCPE